MDRLIGAACGLLAAAISVYIAARLIESVWPVLLGAGVSVGVVAGLVAALRRRRQGW